MSSSGLRDPGRSLLPPMSATGRLVFVMSDPGFCGRPRSPLPGGLVTMSMTGFRLPPSGCRGAVLTGFEPFDGRPVGESLVPPDLGAAGRLLPPVGEGADLRSDDGREGGLALGDLVTIGVSAGPLGRGAISRVVCGPGCDGIIG